MAISKHGVTAIVLNTDPHAKEMLSGSRLATTMQTLCGAVALKQRSPQAGKRHDQKPHI